LDFFGCGAELEVAKLHPTDWLDLAAKHFADRKLIDARHY